MCTNKVRIYDSKHKVYNYFNCGRCHACRQAIAQKRARRIRAHEPDGYTCYFITLTYKNEYVPYVKLSDLYALAKNFNNTELDFDYCVPIHRDTHLRYYRDVLKETHVTRVIGYHEFNNTFKSQDLKDLTTLRTLLNRKQKRYKYDPDKVSIAFNADAANFVKRLRTNLFRSFQKRVDLSYYYAPEYGPTSQRFHLHFLVWFPKGLTREFIEYHVCKAWPYGDKSRTKKYIQVARSPSNYLASYVNCDASVSKFLQTNFRLRPSHSLAFGLSTDIYDFQRVLQAYTERKSFEYISQYYDKSGSLVTLTLPYPRYILDRYFPRFKYFNSLSADKIEQIYLFPERYLRTTPPLKRITSNVRAPFHQCNLVDSYGKSCLLTKSESAYNIRRINYAYDHFFKPRGFSRSSFARICRKFNDDYSIWLYIKSQSDLPPDQAVQSFYNCGDIINGLVSNETVYSYITPLIQKRYCKEDRRFYDVLDPNIFPLEIEATEKLNKKYDDNIKHRNVNNYE